MTQLMCKTTCTRSPERGNICCAGCKDAKSCFSRCPHDRDGCGQAIEPKEVSDWMTS